MNIVNTTTSQDKTKKYFFSAQDFPSAHIEACLLQLQRYGYIICVSSQIGCAQKCQFCAASKSKFVRNLTSDEIQEQVKLIVEDNPALLIEGFQVTYMGSGEPLNNHTNVFHSINNLRDHYPSLGKVNISTTCPAISEDCFKEIDWANYRDFLHFQYSLHFTNDADRHHFLWPNLLGISKAIEYLNNISDLLNDTYKINYIPFDSINDSETCIKELERIMKSTHRAILKISSMCEISGSSLIPSRSFEYFASRAKEVIENVEIFHSDGTDVNAGCGQFYNDSII